MERVKICLEVSENVDDYISDILCWLQGFLAGRGEEFGSDMSLLNPAIEELKELNYKIKQALKAKINSIPKE